MVHKFHQYFPQVFPFIYRKISNISPGLIFDFGSFFGLIFEGAYIRGGLYSRGTIFEGFFLPGMYILYGIYVQNSLFFSPVSKICEKKKGFFFLAGQLIQINPFLV